MDIDVFNGDADGICAVHQWRLAHPAASQLVTGVKRDINLLAGLAAAAGDRVSVFDISFDSNRRDALRLLDAGVELRWFDHHHAGELPDHPGLAASIDTAADCCSSLLVDRALGGRFRAWAIVAAFGDNLHEVGAALAAQAGLDRARIEALAELGELLNYNGYGDAEADLHFPPRDLYLALREFAEPADFIAASPAFVALREGFAADLAAAGRLAPRVEAPRFAAYVLPDEAWARRVVGTLANRLANAAPERAHALLVPNGAGNYTVSVRAAKLRPDGADVFCRGFATGGGRKAAAGINHLPPAELGSFLDRFATAFG